MNKPSKSKILKIFISNTDKFKQEPLMRSSFMQPKGMDYQELLPLKAI